MNLEYDVTLNFATFLSQVLPSDLFMGFKWPFQGLIDLYLGDQRVTWKKLVCIFYIHLHFF